MRTDDKRTSSWVSKSRALSPGGLCLAGTFVVAGCGTSGSEHTTEGDVATMQSALVPSDCGSVTECGDSLHENFDYGRWPGGVIPYRFDGNFPTNVDQTVRQAMADWVRMSGGVISFQQTSAASTSHAPVVTIVYLGNGGRGHPFQNCSMWGGCTLELDQNFAYHEIGHVIGFPHAHQRNDRIHYLDFFHGPFTGRTNCGDDQWDRYPNSLHDFGPFDFFSSLSYDSNYPKMSRWNGQPILAGSSCGTAELISAPLCPPGDVSSIFCSTCGPGSSWLAGDQPCVLRRPFGVPSRGDGSAVAETYRNLFDPGWRKFARTSSYIDDTSPTVAALASGVSLSATASPAVIALNPGTAALFGSGPNGRVYMKDLYLGQQWTDIGAPGGSGTLSDPAAASWDGTRVDVVVTRKGSSSSVRIKSSNDYGSNWTTWGSLGTPSAGAASAPAVVSWGSGRLDVLVRGGNNRLYWRRCTANCTGSSGSWSSWTQIGGSENVRGKPAAVSRANGTFDVVVQNTSGQLRKITNTNDAWSSWTTISASSLPNGAPKFVSSCSDCSSPAAGARGSSGIDVYVRGQDDKVWLAQCAAGGGCGSFVALGGVLNSSPAAVARPYGDGTLHVAAAMPEERNPGVFVNDFWVKTYDANQFFPRQLAVHPNGDGRLELFYNGVDDVLYRKWQPNWSTDVANPRTDVDSTAQKIAVGRNADGRLELFYVTGNNELRRSSQVIAGSRFGHGELLKSGVKDVAVASTSDGRLVAVMTGVDDVLFRAHQFQPNGTWSTPTFLGQPTDEAKRVAAVRDIDARVEAIYIGTNDVLYHNQNVSLSDINWWSGEALISGTTTAKRMAIAVNEVFPAGRLDLIFTGTDDVLRRVAQSSDGWNWGTPVLLNAATHKAKELAVAVNQGGRLEAFYIGLDNVLYHTWQLTPGSSAWSGEVLLHNASTTATQLAASRNADGRLEVFYVGMDGVMYRMSQVSPGSSWTTPVPL